MERKTSGIEWIDCDGLVLGILIRASYKPEKTEFITPDSYKQQAGFIVYGAGEEIVPHLHHEMERSLKGTSEVLMVREGGGWVDFYREDKSFFATYELTKGDVLILCRGGHGFRMREDTVFMEIKQGPYIGIQEKERFEREAN